MRVAIYARYSSELQDARSITDQVAAAREHAARHGWQVVAVYSDAAISGSAIANRPGMLTLLAEAAAGAFDAVLSEDVDRLSRGQADSAGIYERLTYLGIKIVTLADGEIGKLQIGVKGLLSSLYLDNLAQKTRRGQVGRVKAGRIPGGRCYGYDVVESGADRGQRRINPAEQAIVLRIFQEYVGGASPLAIAGRLNAERIPAPRGGQWNASTINGSRQRLNGILSNSLYRGRIVFNRQRFVKDPATGKRQSRPNPKSEWIEQDVPDLAIVPRELFAAAQALRKSAGGARPLGRQRRPKRLLSGLVTCGCCGASMIVVRDDRVGCSARQNKATCTMSRTIRLHEIETRILSALQAHLLAPDIAESAIAAYRDERTRLAKSAARQQRDAERDLAAVDRKIAGIVATIEAGGDPRALAQRLNDLETERRKIADRMPPPKNVTDITLHQRAAERYRAKVAEIHAALSKGDAAARDAIALVRQLITTIIVTPSGNAGPLQLELVGDAAALMMPPDRESGAISVVAGACNSQYRAVATANVRIPFRLCA